MNTKTDVRWFIGLALGAVALAGTATTGYAVGVSSNRMAQTAYQLGVETARSDYCNLQFDDSRSPVADDPRTYAGLPESVVVADDSCSAELVTSWNNAQASVPSDRRACIIDGDLTAIVGAYVCSVPTSTAY